MRYGHKKREEAIVDSIRVDGKKLSHLEAMGPTGSNPHSPLELDDCPIWEQTVGGPLGIPCEFLCLWGSFYALVAATNRALRAAIHHKRMSRF